MQVNEARKAAGKKLLTKKELARMGKVGLQAAQEQPKQNKFSTKNLFQKQKQPVDKMKSAH